MHTRVNIFLSVLIFFLFFGLECLDDYVCFIQIRQIPDLSISEKFLPTEIS